MGRDSLLHLAEQLILRSKELSTIKLTGFADAVGKEDANLKLSKDRRVDFKYNLAETHTNEEAIAGVVTGLIGLGESVTWRAKHFGVYQRLTSKITEFEYPNYFVDEMVEGAFKCFKHGHYFENTSNGGTLMTDIFDYESPLGFLGKWADKLFLKKYMTKLLTQRNQTIKEFAETERWRQVLID